MLVNDTRYCLRVILVRNAEDQRTVPEQFYNSYHFKQHCYKNEYYQHACYENNCPDGALFGCKDDLVSSVFWVADHAFACLTADKVSYSDSDKLCSNGFHKCHIQEIVKINKDDECAFSKLWSDYKTDLWVKGYCESYFEGSQKIRSCFDEVSSLKYYNNLVSDEAGCDDSMWDCANEPYWSFSPAKIYQMTSCDENIIMGIPECVTALGGGYYLELYQSDEEPPAISFISHPTRSPGRRFWPPEARGLVCV